MNRLLRVAAPALVVAAGLVALAVGLTLGGGAAPLPLQDPGPLVRWGLPVAKLLVNLGAAGLIGALVLACFAFTPGKKEYDGALDVASGSAAVFAVSAAGTGLLTFLDVTGSRIDDPQLGDKLAVFLSAIELGQAWLLTTLAAAAVTVLAFAVRNQTAVAFLTVLALAALIPMAQQGHAAGTSGHDAAIIALGLHLAGAAAWLGGLVTLVILRGRFDRERLPVVLARYSSVALVCFLVVAVSGYASAALRLGDWAALAESAYGVLVVAKVLALIALGVFGALQRRVLLSRLRAAGRAAAHRLFWFFITAELAVMGLAAGTAAALARTAAPVPEVLPTDPTPAEILTGEPLPPPPDWSRYVTEWDIDLLWLLACGFGVFFYLAGVVRLRRRGDRWPLYRSVLWVAGMLLLFFVTSGGVNVYETYLFSAHMLGHMALTMMVPLLLVPGAPVTLAARAIAKRNDGSRGGREWILLAVHSRFAGVVANPLVAAGLFAGSLWVFYYTPLMRWTMEDHLGHEWMVAHFLITGYLFVQSFIGVDPVPYRLPYPFRLLLLLGTMVFHAFFGLALMSGTTLLLADWYGAMGWGIDALADQQLGGGIAWSVGEIPTVVLAIVVAVQWSRADRKETRRQDRNADRTGDAELHAYNDRLARLAERDGAAP